MTVVWSRCPANVNRWKIHEGIIFASGCRSFKQFGCYVTTIWMTNSVSLMTQILRSYKFTILLRDKHLVNKHGLRYATLRITCKARIPYTGVRGSVSGMHYALSGKHRKACKRTRVIPYVRIRHAICRAAAIGCVCGKLNRSR